MNEMTCGNPANGQARKAEDFLGLLAAGRQAGRLGDAAVRAIWIDLATLLRKKCAAYTRGDSDSVREETARALMEGVLYTLTVWQSRYPSADLALDEIISRGTVWAYREGSERLRQMAVATELYYLNMRGRRVKCDNIAYEATLMQALPGFFKNYDTEFFPQENIITADYPVTLYPREKSGILMIREYLKSWATEDAFCACFDAETLNKAVARFASHTPTPAREQIISLFEIALSQALSQILCGAPAAKAQTNAPDLSAFDGAVTHLLRMPALTPAVRAYVRAALARDPKRIFQTMRLLYAQ